MAENSKIEWTDATWNPITGCSVVSPGCTNCYAMRLAGGRLRNHPSRKGLTKPSKAGPVWTGEVRLNEEWLDQPLRWRRPRRIFVCAHGDLFHEAIPWHWIGAVFEVMRDSPRHLFQVLTKRPERAFEFVERVRLGKQIAIRSDRWPLSNVQLGVSVEDQVRANERIPYLLATPSTNRFISAEPLLGPVDLSRMGLWLCKHWKTKDALPHAPWCPEDPSKWWWDRQALRGPGQIMLDWIIAGGESGPHARPLDLDWARAIRDQCKAAGVAFFMKQIDKKAPIPDDLLIREFPESTERSRREMT